MISQERIDQLEPGERYLLHAPNTYQEPTEIIFIEKSDSYSIKYYRKMYPEEERLKHYFPSGAIKEIDRQTWLRR